MHLWQLFEHWVLVRIYSRRFRLPSSLLLRRSKEGSSGFFNCVGSLTPPKLVLLGWNGRKIITARNWRCVSRTVKKEGELAAFEEEYRSITDGKLSPNATPAASVVSSKEPVETCDSDLMDEETPPSPPAEGQPTVFNLPSPPLYDHVQVSN